MGLFIQKIHTERVREKTLVFHLVSASLFLLFLSEILLDISFFSSPSSQFPFVGIILLLSLYIVSGLLKDFRLSSNLLVGILIALGLFNFANSGDQLSGSFWIYTLPVLIFFLLERIEALLWIMSIFFFLLLIILFSGFGLIDPYPLLQMVASLSLVTGLSYLLVYINDLTTTTLKEKNHQIKMIARKGIKDIDSLKDSLNRVAGKNMELESSKDAIMDVINQIDSEKDKVFEQREKLRIILESIGDGVLVMDTHRRIALINRTTEEITGYTKRELMGQNYSQILRLLSDNKDRTRYFDLVTKIYESGFISSGSDAAYLIRKDGEKIPVSFSASPIKNLGGKVIGCVLVFRDTTREKEIDKMKTEFVSVASHQLRTPLTGIKWYSELLSANEEKNLTEEQVEFIQSIEENTHRMIELVNDLLDVSRIDMGQKFLIEKEPSDLISLIDTVIKELSVVASEKKIKILKADPFPRKLKTLVDKKKITQVFENLISNAVKYSPEGSQILVDCEENQNNILFSVRDNGVGIPQEQQSQIFTKFFRAENVSNGKFEGTGLGLYIVKAIVEGHSGKVWFDSRQDQGTTFFVELPKI